MSSLTPEQLKKIEENRLAALKRRQERQKSLLSSKEKNPHQFIYSDVTKSKSHDSSVLQPDIQNKCMTYSVISNKNDMKSFYGQTSEYFKVGKNCETKFSYKINQTDVNTGESTDLSKLDINKVLLPRPTAGDCYLISKTRFLIDIPFHEKLIDLLKTVPGKMYDAKERKWNFPLSQYKNLLKKIELLNLEISINPLPKFILKEFLLRKLPSVSSESIDISCLSPELKKQLYPFQIEGIQFAISKNGRCLIADEMGLGKTLQALGVADYYKSQWPLLIVCPSSMRYQWEEEVCKYIPSVPLHMIFIMKSSKDYIDEDLVKVLIVSYDLLGKQTALLKKLKFGVAILDESHSLKSSKTQRTKAALDIVKKIGRVILLSGTPALSRPCELYTQLEAIHPSAFSSFKEYGLRYCDGKMTNFGWNFSGSSNLGELKVLLESKYMIRRLKKDVILQLPSKIRQVIVLNNDDIKTQSQTMQEYADRLKQTNLKGMERRGQLLLYFAETGRTKLKAVCDYIAKLLDEGKKFLCFAHHKEVLDKISETVQKCQNEYIRIDGKVSTEDRKMLCDKFQYEEKYRVAVLSIKAANTGLTLTSAQLVVFAELFWNPGELIQAEDRAHRIGQQDSVFVQYLLAKGTADDYLWPLVLDKLDVLTKVGLSKDTFTDMSVSSLNRKTDCKQQEMTDYFMSDELEEENLNKLMDEIDGVVEKKRKIN
ncbi:SWI/SNF-related matrix-associated actin-dependent regulator of chromatin subfamily A-like protein 1 isoform X1 [Lycorma delicatula]|uniref:SWI/SNF-related matrix-associated actin-dependent regulator of chromatin subfamily A-like protein 1 isoform X1 n=1 Tax=Lycorma delicatula TaxID=130591 RepID=UPI003F50F281